MAGAASLPKKLGVRAGSQVVVLGAPERTFRSLELGDVADVKVSRQLRRAGVAEAPVDVVMLFVDKLADLETRIGAVTESLHPHGQVWVAWRSRRAQDIREGLVRRIGLAAGMVDTRVCAIDDVWSGMRLVISPANRDALAYRIDRPHVQAPRRARRSTSGPGSGLQTARARKRA
jgi:hypothetical protein